MKPLGIKFSEVSAWLEERPMKVYSSMAIAYEGALALNASPDAGGSASLLWAAAAIPAWIGNGYSVWKGNGGEPVKDLVDFDIKQFAKEMLGTVNYIGENFTSKAWLEFNDDFQRIGKDGIWLENITDVVRPEKNPVSFMFGLFSTTGAMYLADASNVFNTRAQADVSDAAIGALIMSGALYAWVTNNPATSSRIFTMVNIPTLFGALEPFITSVVSAIQNNGGQIEGPNVALSLAFCAGMYMNYVMSKIKASTASRQGLEKARVQASDNDVPEADL